MRERQRQRKINEVIYKVKIIFTKLKRTPERGLAHRDGVCVCEREKKNEVIYIAKILFQALQKKDSREGCGTQRWRV